MFLSLVLEVLNISLLFLCYSLSYVIEFLKYRGNKDNESKTNTKNAKILRPYLRNKENLSKSKHFYIWFRIISECYWQTV